MKEVFLFMKEVILKKKECSPKLKKLLIKICGKFKIDDYEKSINDFFHKIQDKN